MTVILLFIFFCTQVLYSEQDTFVIHSNAQSKPLQLFMGVASNEQDLIQLSDLLRAHLEWSKQIAITRHTSCPRTQQDMSTLFHDGYTLGLFLARDHDGYSCRLYDLTQGRMIMGKKYAIPGADSTVIARCIGHDLWRQMMGEASPFCSSLCYIKKTNDRVPRYELCIADYDGTSPKTLLYSSRIIVAPSWNNDTRNPAIFFSEFTPSNVRILAIDMSQRVRTVFDFDGTIVGVSCDTVHEKNALYCRSGSIWHFTYDPDLKRSTHSLIINELGTCASPTLFSNGDIIFCSQGKIKYYMADTRKVSLITDDGYCVAPTGHYGKKKIAYSRRIGAYMQLFVYDMASQLHKQISFDKGDKTDAAWSPCGNYLVFVHSEGASSSIEVMHVATGSRSQVTDSHDYCSYPAWSPSASLLFQN